MRPMDEYLKRIKQTENDKEIEAIIQEVYVLGFDRGKQLTEKHMGFGREKI